MGEVRVWGWACGGEEGGMMTGAASGNKMICSRMESLKISRKDMRN